MSSSNSILRRYTPPTCTLEITAAGSPLSRWLGRPAIEQLQFQLSLDDPRLPEEERLTLKGDKTQLEALREAVETYVQDLLGQLPETSIALLPPAATDTAERLHAESPSANLAFDTTNNETTVAPATSPEEIPQVDSGEEGLPAKPPAVAGNIYLAPDGMLAHNLYLGSLATPESGQMVRLSTLQLFDLATAFEQYAEELVALPNLKGTQKKGLAYKLKTTPIWAKTAAGLVLAVGATAAGVQLANRNTSLQTANAPAVNPTPTPTEQPPIAAIPSPSPTLVVPTPPLSSSQILPTPTLGAGGSPSPNASPPLGTGVSPNQLPGMTPSPTPSQSLGAGVTPSPTIGSPTSGAGTTSSPTIRSLPNGFQSSPPTGSPAAGRPPSGSYKIPVQFDTPRPTTPATPSPTGSSPLRNDASSPSRSVQGGSRPSPSPAVAVPPNPVERTPNRERERTERAAVRSTPTPNPTFFPRPDEAPKAAPSTVRVPATIPAPTIQAPPAIPTPSFVMPTAIPTPPPAFRAATPPPAAASRSATPSSAAVSRSATPSPAAASRSATPSPAAASRSATPSPAAPSRPATPSPAPASPAALPTPIAAAPAVIPTPTPTATNPDPSVTALRSAPTPKPEENRIPAAERDNTSAFAPIPQVGEVERYFRQRWQPPSTLTQDIEYTLSLNPDGSIKSVTPRGQTAEIYLDRTEMPLVGEPFVSPIEGGRNTTIILVLSKDGKVQAFLGSSN